MRIPFVKLQGAGNDYIAIDGRNTKADWHDLAKVMSRPAFGVGSDGIVLLEDSRKAQVKLRVFNPDGTEAEMSGNGIRLFVKFVIDRKFTKIGTDGSLKVETLGGIRTVWPKIVDGKVISAKVAMGRPIWDPKRIPAIMKSKNNNNNEIVDHPIDVNDMQLNITCLSIGNPHAVTFLDTPVEDFPLTEIGPLIENHSAFPNRINFEIVNILTRNRIRARIFERGAGETLSSGTGSTASALAARRHGLVEDNVEVVVDGGVLNISWDKTGETYLEGPAVEVFEGTWLD